MSKDHVSKQFFKHVILILNVKFSNEDSETYTSYPHITNDLLYQLSYGGGNSNYVYSSKGENLNGITLLGKLL